MTGVKLATTAALPAASRTHAVRRWARWRGPYLAQVGALALTYYVAAHVGYAFEFAGPVAAILWLPVGVAISFLYLGGVGLWPGVVIGDLLVNDYSTLPLGSAVGQTFGNLLEVLVATLLMRRLIPRGAPLASVRGVARMVMAMAAGATVSATVGALSLRAGDVIATGAAPDVWRTWWLGDFAGALIVVPLALAWYRPLPRHWSRARAIEGALMVGAVAAASEVAFRSHEPVAYLVFPTLIWAALRFGERGAAQISVGKTR
jgi:integral membrane sensor domain MASE1